MPEVSENLSTGNLHVDATIHSLYRQIKYRHARGKLTNTEGAVEKVVLLPEIPFDRPNGGERPDSKARYAYPSPDIFIGSEHPDGRDQPDRQPHQGDHRPDVIHSAATSPPTP